jgi:hypothetical protein
VGVGVACEVEVCEAAAFVPAVPVFMCGDFVEACAAAFDGEDGVESEVDVDTACFAF